MGLQLAAHGKIASIAPKRKNQYQPLHLETIDTDAISYLFLIYFFNFFDDSADGGYYGYRYRIASHFV